MSEVKIPSRLAAIVRKAAGVARRPVPIAVVPGDAAPALQGEESYYVWVQSGQRVTSRYPVLYHHLDVQLKPSTLRVEVGEGWLSEHR